MKIIETRYADTSLSQDDWWLRKYWHLIILGKEIFYLYRQYSRSYENILYYWNLTIMDGIEIGYHSRTFMKEVKLADEVIKEIIEEEKNEKHS